MIHTATQLGQSIYKMYSENFSHYVKIADLKVRVRIRARLMVRVRVRVRVRVGLGLGLELG